MSKVKIEYYRDRHVHPDYLRTMNFPFEMNEETGVCTFKLSIAALEDLAVILRNHYIDINLAYGPSWEELNKGAMK